MSIRHLVLPAICILCVLLLPGNAGAANLTCHNNLTYASDYYTCGGDLVDQNRYEEALLAFQTARSMDERFYDEHFGISYEIGWILNRLGRYEEALTEFKKAEKYHPEWINNFVIYYNEGCLYAKLGNYEEALSRFDTSLTVQYYNIYAWFNKGLVLARMGRYAEAADSFDKARKATGSRVPLLGSYREAANTFDAARGTPHPGPTPTPAVTLSAARTVYPAPTYIVGLSTDLQLRKADDLTARYQFEDAVQAYDQLLVNDPSNYRAMKGRGIALANLGRFGEALTSLEQASLYLDYHQDEANYLDTWYVRGWVLANLERYNESIEAFNKIFIVNPDHFLAHYNKAWVLSRQGEYRSAAEEYNRSLDWEHQVSYEVKAGTILGPLGDYREAADAIDKAGTAPASRPASGSAQNETLIYRADFARDPAWQTTQPRVYFWRADTQTFNFRSDENPGYAEIPVRYGGTSFRLEFNVSIPHADPGTTVLFGISQYNATYNEQNAIFAEFKSWKHGMYRNVKDGDKLYQIKAIDSMKHTTNEQYQGACFINREDDRANATFGEGRVYHVIIQYNREKNLIETRVTDNLHEKNYYVCSGIWYDIGTFRGMDRLILVARQEAGAYIEGYIDDVSLSDIGSSPIALTGPSPVQGAPVSADSSDTPASLNASGFGQASAGGGGLGDSPITVIVTLVGAGIAGSGVYLWQKNRTPPAQYPAVRHLLKRERDLRKKISRMELFSPGAGTILERAAASIRQERYAEAGDLLTRSDRTIDALAQAEERARGWKKEGFDISSLVAKVNADPDTFASSLAGFGDVVGRSRGVISALEALVRDHKKSAEDPAIAGRIEALKQRVRDPLVPAEAELNEVRDLIREHEERASRAAARADQEQQEKRAAEQTDSARTAALGLLEEARRIGAVPVTIEPLIRAPDPAGIEQGIAALRQFMATAVPRLVLSLDRRTMEVQVWHKVTISIENTGDAHALDVSFSFSKEFETRWIRPKSIPAGTREVFENIAIKPAIKGEVPLEIILTFHDARNKEYTEKKEFFIEVIESVSPHTPAFTPDVTPSRTPPTRQLPPELAHLFTDPRYIGRGGFARVFRATRRDGRNVAIKVPISIDPSTGRTFVSEIQNWTRMVHENIVKVYDYNIMPPYFEMELCDSSLATLKKPVPNEKAAWLVFSICEGLKYAHAQNIIHRDLKPQNILIRNGIPKISDWGLSRVMLSQSTTSAASSFTLSYAAPEQVNNRRQDARTDLWQLGVIFYELATGTLPFKGETVTDTIIAIATQDPSLPSSINPDAADLDSIILRSLEKDPEKRYASALEFQKAIGAYLKMNYASSLNESLLTNNYGRSADYCADLLMVNMKLGGLVDAYKYASDLAEFLSGDLKEAAAELAGQLKSRMELNLATVPDELTAKADILVHKIKLQHKQ